MAEKAHDLQEPLFEGSVRVREKRPLRTWNDWNSRYKGGPRLVIAPRSVCLYARQGMMLEKRNYDFDPGSIRMRRTRVGWAGLPFNDEECIELSVGNGLRTRKFAIYLGENLERAWEALVHVGLVVESDEVM